MGENAECEVGGEEEGHVEYARDDQVLETGKPFHYDTMLTQRAPEYLDANTSGSVDTEEAGRSIQRNNG